MHVVEAVEHQVDSHCFDDLSCSRVANERLLPGHFEAAALVEPGRKLNSLRLREPSKVIEKATCAEILIAERLLVDDVQATLKRELRQQ